MLSLTRALLRPAGLWPQRVLSRCWLALGLVLFGAAPVEAAASASFPGLTQVVGMGGITLVSPSTVVPGSDGTLYIVDTGNNRVVTVTPQGVASALAITGLSSLSGPTGAALDGSGNLYLADTGNNRVVMVTPGGAGTVVATPGLSGPRGLAMDRSGNLFIADPGNNRVVEVPASASGTPVLITGAALSQPWGLAVDAAGDLFIADYLNHYVVKMDAGGSLGAALPAPGGIAMSHTAGVAVDGYGNVFIADGGAGGQLLTVDTAGHAGVMAIPSMTSSRSNATAMTVATPLGLAVDHLGTIYVADTGHNRILKLSPAWSSAVQSGAPGYSLNHTALNFGHATYKFNGGSGTVTLYVPLPGPSDSSQFVYASAFGTQTNQDFSVDNGGTNIGAGQNPNLAVTFTPNGPGQRLGALVIQDAPNGNILATIPLCGFGDSPLIAVSPSTNNTSDNILTSPIFGTGGNSQQIPSYGVYPTSPYQVAVDGSGTIYFDDQGGSRTPGAVYKLTKTGKLTTLNFTPSLPDPTGLALDAAGNLFVADGRLGVIEVYTAAGVCATLAIANLPSSLAGTLTGQLCFDAAGNLFILNNASQIVKVSNLLVTGTTATGYGTLVDTGNLTFSSPITGIAVDPSGSVYLAAGVSNNGKVAKVTAAGICSLVNPTGITTVNPSSVCTDGFGDLYIMDPTRSGQAKVYRVIPGGQGVPVPFINSAASMTMTVDPDCNLYFPAFRIVYTDISNVTMSFPVTGVNGSSAPGTIQVTNLGNQNLIFTDFSGYPSGFTENTSDATLLTASTVLPSGAFADISAIFTPTSQMWYNTGFHLRDNSKNDSNSQQNLSLYGTPGQPGDATATAVVASPTSMKVGQTTTFTATVTDTAYGHSTTVPTGGTVAFTDSLGQTLPSAALVNGQAALTVQLGAGNHTITAIYSGVSGTFWASQGTTGTVTVIGLTPTIELASAANPGRAGSNSFTATVTSAQGTPTGWVYFYDGVDLVGRGSLSSGVVTAALSLVVGTHPITAVYQGDATFGQATSEVVNEVILAALPIPTVTLSTSAIQAVPGAPVTFTATVASSLGTPTGTVDFYDGSVLLGSGTLASGVATYTTTALALGSHPMTAQYGGDSAFQGAKTSKGLTEMISLLTATVTLSPSLNPAGAGTSVTFTVTVASAQGSPTGTVTFQDFSGAFPVRGPIALVSGVAVCTTTGLTVGSHPIVVWYSGDGTFYPASSASLTEVINAATGTVIPTVTLTSSANPAAVGTAITFTATVASPEGTPNGYVKFYDGSTLLGSDTLVAGVAHGTTLALAAGTHAITAAYGGDSNFSAMTSGVLSEVINAATPTVTPTITLASSTNPAVAGVSITFTATVASSQGTPTGPVNFYDGSTLLGSASLASGAAGYTTSVLAPGTHAITAAYGGDSNFSAVTSGVLSEVINAATPTVTPTITLASSANPAVAGVSITFTATVASSQGTPTGPVHFYDGSTLLGSDSLASGVASYTTSVLAPGTHAITAAYGGDSNFSAVTSESLMEEVDAAVGTLAPTITPSLATPGTLYLGQPVGISVTVAGTPGTTPTGTVTFLVGTTSLGSATLVGGTATLTTTNLTLGDNSITVSYSGDDVYTKGVSPAIHAIMNQAAATVVVVENGGTATTTLTLAGLGPQGTPITFTTTGLPAGASITFDKNAVDVSNGLMVVNATITVTPRLLIIGRNLGAGSLGGLVGMLGCCILVLPSGRRRKRSGLFLSALVVVLVGGLTACSNHNSNKKGITNGVISVTPAGVYTVSITTRSQFATAATTTIQLTVH